MMGLDTAGVDYLLFCVFMDTYRLLCDARCLRIYLIKGALWKGEMQILF